VLDGDPAPPPPKGGGAPNFRPISVAAKWHGWIKMPLGMEVGLSPGDFVLDGDPDTLPKMGAERPSPIFSPFLLWSNGCNTAARCHLVRR